MGMSRGMMIAIGIAGVFLVVCCIVGIVLATKKDDSPAPAPATSGGTSGSGTTSGGTSGSGASAPIPSSSWRCLTSSDGSIGPVRKNAGGDVECMSSDGGSCLWKTSQAECNALVQNPVSPMNPLTCGTMHQQLYGSTGYDNPAHWCSTMRSQI